MIKGVLGFIWGNIDACWVEDNLKHFHITFLHNQVKYILPAKWVITTRQNAKRRYVLEIVNEIIEEHIIIGVNSSEQWALITCVAALIKVGVIRVFKPLSIGLFKNSIWVPFTKLEFCRPLNCLLHHLIYYYFSLFSNLLLHSRYLFSTYFGWILTFNSNFRDILLPLFLDDLSNFRQHFRTPLLLPHRLRPLDLNNFFLLRLYFLTWLFLFGFWVFVFDAELLQHFFDGIGEQDFEFCRVCFGYFDGSVGFFGFGVFKDLVVEDLNRRYLLKLKLRLRNRPKHKHFNTRITFFHIVSQLHRNYSQYSCTYLSNLKLLQVLMWRFLHFPSVNKRQETILRV